MITAPIFCDYSAIQTINLFGIGVKKPCEPLSINKHGAGTSQTLRKKRNLLRNIWAYQTMTNINLSYTATFTDNKLFESNSMAVLNGKTGNE